MNDLEFYLWVNMCNQSAGMLPLELVTECFGENIGAHTVSRLINDSELFSLELLVQPGNTDVVRALQVPHCFTFPRFADSRTSLVVLMDFEL